MVITILEGQVASDRIDDLERAYKQGASNLPVGLLESFLARDIRDESMCRIISVWSSREALESMRASVEKPKGVLFFEAAGASPELTILEILEHTQDQD
jgi:hypothetical protein